MFFLSIPTGEVCPRFTAQGYCMQSNLDSPVNLRARGNSYTTCFPCRLTPFFIFEVALNWTCKSFWKSAFECICPSWFWDPWHSMAGWARSGSMVKSVHGSVVYDEDRRGLCRTGVKQAVNWRLTWQIVQQIVIDVSGRAVGGAWAQTRTGKSWKRSRQEGISRSLWRKPGPE